MSAMNFNTSTDTFRKLMGNGIFYTVPQFQRDYSWTEDEWEDLWQDILDVCQENKEPAHYMGYLVLQSRDNKRFEIIDGQQRVTTLSILVLAVLKNLRALQDRNLEAQDNQKREEQLRSTYIGYLDPVSLVSVSKLRLNRHNDAFYQNYIVSLSESPRRGLRFSEKLMKRSLAWFTERVAKDVSNERGADLARFIDQMADKLFFTVITVTDELNAFKVFETLNARGVRLSSTDLLKNYLFSVVNNAGPHETEIVRLEDYWERIVGTLGGESFPDFLRVFWNSRHKLVRKTDLFKTIKTTVSDKGRVFSLVRELDVNANIYAAFQNAEDEFWTREQRPFIRELRMFNVRQPYALLMIAHCRFNEQDFTRLLKACAIIAFRYNVICNAHTGEQERVYNAVAMDIAQGRLTNAATTIQRLKQDVYPDDKIFQSAFADKVLSTVGSRNKKVVRYILFALERYLSRKSYDFDNDQYTVEHILPESPEEWCDYEETKDAAFICRLGNYTLLTKKENQAVGNKVFETKKRVYAQSCFMLTRKLAEENLVWNRERIAKRQELMAKWAKTVWRLT